MRVVRLLPLIFAGLLACNVAQARGHHHAHERSAASSEVAATALPPEAQHTLSLIQQGGPYPYPRDGIVFGNREHKLPAQVRGYYHEYTVPTPGARDRGARRIVCGPLPECYYSDDHYRSFRRINGGH